MRRPRLLLIGHGRHGKDTAAALLADRLRLSFVSSSEFAAAHAVWPLVADLGIWADWRAAYADRAQHRELWFHAIAAANARPGPSLAARILEDHDLYVGMRARAEFDRSRHLFDLVIWVDAGDRLPPEPTSSNELTRADADLVLDNNGAEADLPARVRDLAWVILERFGDRLGDAAGAYLAAFVAPPATGPGGSVCPA